MEWIGAGLYFASTFSYRMPDTSSQFAIPTLLPGPTTVKLALVSAAIHASCDPAVGAKVFDLLRPADVAFGLPERVAVFRPLIKRLKAQKAEKKKDKGSQLISTFGTRGYVIYSGPVQLYLGLSDSTSDDVRLVENALRHLRYLGTSDSLLTVSDISRLTALPKSGIVRPEVGLRGMAAGGVVQRVKEISPAATFADVNPFAKGKRTSRRGLFLERYYVLPIRTVKEGGKWTLYERV